MASDLIEVNKDSRLVLSKAKNLMGITSKILENKDDNWIEKLWTWADENNLSPKIIPRNKKDLLNIENLKLYGKNLNSIPNEIEKLKNLKFLDLANNNLEEVPYGI